MEVDAPYWDIFEDVLEDNSTKSFEMVEFRESNVNVKNLSRFEIFTKDMDAFFYPHKSYLLLKGQITRENGDPLDTADEVALVNNGFNIFKRAQYYLNDKEVEDIELVGLSTLVQNLVYFTHDYSKSIASQHFWYPDTGEGENDKKRLIYDGAATSLDTNDKIKAFADSLKSNHNFNEGHLQRYRLGKSSKTISMFLPLQLMFGFCRDVQKVMRGVKHTLKLERSDDADILLRGDANTYKFQLNYLSWFIPKLTPSLSMQAKLETQMNNNSKASLSWEGTRIFRSDIHTPADTLVNWRVVTSQSKPTHIYMFFQLASRINNVSSNNMKFDHLNLEKTAAWVNTIQFPEMEFEANFDPKLLDYVRLYTSFLEAGDNISSTVSYQQYMRNYPIFHFDVSKHETRLYDTTSCDIELRYKLHSPPTGNYYTYCIVTSEKSINIEFIEGRLHVLT